jgi:hypothetical protein
MASACKAKMAAEPQDPTEDLTEDEGEPLDPNDESEETTDTVAETGDPGPNLGNLPMGLQPPQSQPIVNAGGVDFTGGVNPNANRFSEAVGTSGALGFDSRGLVPMPPIDDGVRFNEATSNAANAGAGGGGMMPGGGGGMMMGGAPAPGRAGGGGGGGGAGPRTSLAGSQLNKVGQNSFWSGGGGTSGGSSAGRTTAAAVGKKEKVKKVPYNSKGMGDGGLLRLFGNGLKTGLDGTSGSCGDTVFCPMENFFYGIDRFPNSEIKSTDK